MAITRRSLVKRSTAAAGAVALAGSSPSLLAASAMQSEPQQVEYWHRLTGDSAAAIDELAAQFNEQHAGQIEVTPIAQGTIEQLTQKVRAAAAGGGLPAALMADDADVYSYYVSDVIVPLDDYISDAEHGLTTQEREQFLPNQLTRHQLPLYADQTMTFPIGFSTYSFYWFVDALNASCL